MGLTQSPRRVQRSGSHLGINFALLAEGQCLHTATLYSFYLRRLHPPKFLKPNKHAAFLDKTGSFTRLLSYTKQLCGCTHFGWRSRVHAPSRCVFLVSAPTIVPRMADREVHPTNLSRLSVCGACARPPRNMLVRTHVRCYGAGGCGDGKGTVGWAFPGDV